GNVSGRKAAFGFTDEIAITRSGSNTGGCRITNALTRLNTVEFTAIPSASVTTATIVNPGFLASIRAASRKSFRKVPIAHLQLPIIDKTKIGMKMFPSFSPLGLAAVHCRIPNDSVCSSRPAHHPNVWLDGGDGPVRVCLCPASRIQSPMGASTIPPGIQAPARRRVLRNRNRRPCWSRRGQALPRTTGSGDLLERAFQPLRICLVWRPARRFPRFARSRRALSHSPASISGYVLAGRLRRLRHRPDLLPAERRWRLRPPYVAALGYELPERGRADHRARPPHSDL